MGNQLSFLVILFAASWQTGAQQHFQHI